MIIPPQRGFLSGDELGALIDQLPMPDEELGHDVACLAELIQPQARYALSTVTAAELLHGAHRANGSIAHQRSAFVEGLLGGFGIVPVDLVVTRAYLVVTRAYAAANAELAKRGTPVDANDLWIAATAIAHGLDILPLDGDFDRIPGVRRVAA